METISHRFAGALKRLGGDEELFQELMSYFIQDAPGLLEDIQVGVTVGNAESIRRAAHSLRGLAANFDAEQAIIIAASIEQIATKGDLEMVPEAFAHLQVEIQSLGDVLNGCAAQSTSPLTRQ